mmetsp:Transcript_28973/g.72806  ORF Transcript_28973/g.72806 Transcript_28973/m.72806 type:complete len:83 (+) Transcript_28973:2261-2509(+)
MHRDINTIYGPAIAVQAARTTLGATNARSTTLSTVIASSYSNAKPSAVNTKMLGNPFTKSPKHSGIFSVVTSNDNQSIPSNR